jgi:non-heme chloroperoxidase
VNRLIAPFCLLLAFALPARAADIAGTWQTDKPRYVMTITKAGAGWRGEWFNLGDVDGTLNGNPLDVSLDGSSLTLNPVRTPGTFHGSVSADGKTITGDWTHDPGRLIFHHVAAKDAFPIDPAPHKIQFVTVAPGVKLEVLDFGGPNRIETGRPLIFLAGQGRTGHNFDQLALKFTGKHHVYAITRRGYGVSGIPPPTDENYDPDRLGDDVLAVMTALRIEKPVIAGHSISGEELSSIGSRHPEKVAGLIYLDAAYGHAFYDPDNALFASPVAQSIVHRDLRLLRDAPPSRARQLRAELQQTLPVLERDLKADQEFAAEQKDPPLQPTRLRVMVATAIDSNFRPYKTIAAPILVLAAVPQRCEKDCDSATAKAGAALVEKQAQFVTASNRNLRLVRLPHADHFVWRTYPDQVEREMNSFMDGLK